METTARRSRVTYFTAAFVLLTLCLFGPASARAQWTTPNGSGNINNTNTGNVGVGTTTPETIFHVSTASTATGRGITNEQNSNDGLSAVFTFKKSRAGAAVQNTDNLGNIFAAGSDGTSFIGPARMRFTVDGTVSTNNVPVSIQFFTGSSASGSERMRISSGGNVGIATGAPVTRLHLGNEINDDNNRVYDANALMVINQTPTATATLNDPKPVLYLGRQGTAFQSYGAMATFSLSRYENAGAGSVGSRSRLDFALTHDSFNDVNVMTMLSNGSVGIGTGSPTARLHVGGVADNVFSVASTGTAATDTVANFASGVGNILTVRGNGNVGIGATSPAYKLDVAGSVNSSGLCIAGDCKTAWSQVGGSQWASGSGNINYTGGGNVGVGTSAPVRGFHISGPNASVLSEFVLENTGMPANHRKFNLWGSSALGTSGRFFFRLLNDAGNATTRDLMSFDNATGNIGVGTNAPTALLEVGRNQPTGTELKVSNYDAAGFSGLYLDGGFAQSAGGFVQWNNTTSANNMFVATGGAAPLHLGTNNAIRMSILPTSGNVGINTTGPQAKLDVRAGGTLASGPNTALWSPTNTADANTSYVHWGTTGDWYIRPGTTSGKVIMADNGGNIGVGTTSPGAAYKVDVVGNVNSSGLCIAGDCKTAWSQVGGGNPSQWTTAGTNVFYNGGNIGIGNSAPGSQLFIGSGTPPVATLPGINVALGPSSGAYVTATNNTTSTFMGSDGSPYGIVGTLTNHPLGFRANNTLAMSIMPSGYVGIGTSAPSAKLQIISVDDTVAPAFSVRQDNNALYGFDMTLDTNVNGNLTFHRVNNGTQANVLTLDRVSGKVGVGTANPTEALDVVGNIKATGSVSATYQDVAEWVPSSQKLAPGTVVILDAGKTNHVIASGTAYDTKVAGVVSAEPGVILGVGGDDKLKVATTGRVKVKVDASRGAIKVGDLLVTSEVEGVAMKSVPVDLGGVSFHRPGTIIGKALEPLEKGTGEILVLLSLQ